MEIPASKIRSITNHMLGMEPKTQADAEQVASDIGDVYSAVMGRRMPVGTVYRGFQTDDDRLGHIAANRVFSVNPLRAQELESWSTQPAVALSFASSRDGYGVVLSRKPTRKNFVAWLGHEFERAMDRAGHHLAVRWQFEEEVLLKPPRGSRYRLCDDIVYLVVKARFLFWHRRGVGESKDWAEVLADRIANADDFDKATEDSGDVYEGSALFACSRTGQLTFVPPIVPKYPVSGVEAVNKWAKMLKGRKRP